MAVGETVGIVGGALGLASFLLTEWRRRQAGHLTKRHARRQLKTLQESHEDQLAVHDEEARKEHDDIRDKFNADKMLHSSFMTGAQEEAKRRADRQRAEMIRQFEVERDRLRDLIGEKS